MGFHAKIDIAKTMWNKMRSDWMGLYKIEWELIETNKIG